MQPKLNKGKLTFCLGEPVVGLISSKVLHTTGNGCLCQNNYSNNHIVFR